MSARLAARIDTRRLGATRFCIIAADCWGGTAYQKLGRPYNTPFVGLFVEPADFPRLVSDLRGYLACPLRFVDAGKPYPVGMVGDVTLHFLHYSSEAEARVKWERRVPRVDWEHLRVQSQDRGELPVGALILGPVPRPGVVGVRDYTDNGALLYNLSLQEFDVVTWLRSGVVRSPRLYQRFLHGLSRFKRGLAAEAQIPLRITAGV